MLRTFLLAFLMAFASAGPSVAQTASQPSAEQPDSLAGFIRTRWIITQPTIASDYFLGFLAVSGTLQVQRGTSCGPQQVGEGEVEFSVATGLFRVTRMYRPASEICAGDEGREWNPQAAVLDTLQVSLLMRKNSIQQSYPSPSLQALAVPSVGGVRDVGGAVPVTSATSDSSATPAMPAASAAPASPTDPATPAIPADPADPATPATTGSSTTLTAPFSQSGQLVRGFTIGTNQDPTLVSSLRLNLQGPLTESLMLDAQLTDQSLPIQPEGTTLRLQEIDRVYARISSATTRIEMGDVDLDLRQGEFTRIQRRIQGGVGSFSEAGRDLSAGISVERGTYRSQRIQPIQGIRGPYRLTGALNEPYILILPGTERVWLDGRQLARGADDGYVIDYTLSEIRFLGGRFITPESRITVEFQYHTSDYTRTLLTSSGSSSVLDGRASIGVSYLRQADVNEAARTPFLAQAGDLPPNSFISGVDSVGAEFSDNVLLYTRLDTLVNGEVTRIYVHRPENPSNVYRVRFSDVGEGNGSYERGFENANGILYRWVGLGQGRFEPVVRALAPLEHQLLGVRTSLRVLPRLVADVEWGISNTDRNRFSPLDDQENLDHGFLAHIRLDSLPTSIAILSADIRTRYTGKRFRTFEPLREIEFDQIWGLSGIANPPLGGAAPAQTPYSPARTPDSNALRWSPLSPLSPSPSLPRPSPLSLPLPLSPLLPISTLQQEASPTDPLELGQTEWSHRGSLTAVFSPTSRMWLSAERLDLDALQGSRATWELELDEPGWPSIRYRGDLARQQGLTSTPLSHLWSTQQAGMSRPFPVGTSKPRVTITPRADILYETRQWNTDKGTSPASSTRRTLMDGSYEVLDILPGLTLNTRSVRVSAAHGLRDTYRAQDGLMAKESGAVTSRLALDWDPEDMPLRTSTRFGMRESRQERSFHIESDTRYGERGGASSGSLLYTLDTEQRQIRQEMFVFTGPELGTHVWEDLNGDGIPQLDEFFPEVIDGEGQYVLQFVPSPIAQPVTEFSMRWLNESELLGASKRARTKGSVLENAASDVFRDRGGEQASLRLLTTAFVRESSSISDPLDLALLKFRHFQDPDHTLSGSASLLQQLTWTPQPRSTAKRSPNSVSAPGLVRLPNPQRPARWVAEVWAQSSLSQRGLGSESRSEWRGRLEGEWSPDTRRTSSPPSALMDGDPTITTEVADPVGVRAPDRVFTPRIRFNHQLLLESKSASNDRLSGRDYDILSLEAVNGVTITWNRSFSSGLDLAFSHKMDRNPSEEASLNMLRVAVHSRVNLKGGIRNQFRVEWRTSSLDGVTSPYGLFELTEGSGTGSRLLWSLQSNGRISQNLQLGLRSSGRSLSGGIVRQTAEMTLKAMF